MMARRITSAREQVEMLSPWREAANDDPYAPGPDWFHASPYELAPGTMLVPRGGKTTWNRFYNQLDPQEAQEIQNHVWLDNNINISKSRAHGRGHYIYRVEPTTEPRELGLAGGGHCTDSACVKELVGRTPKRQRRRGLLSPWHEASAAQDEAEAAGKRLPPLPVRRQKIQDEYWMKKPWAEGETLLRPHGKNVTLYHRTSPERADKLVEKGFKRKKNPDTKDVYFSDVLGDAKASDFGEAIVKVVLPHHAIGPRNTAPMTFRQRRLDDPEDADWHQDGPAENWYQIDSKYLKGVPVERIV